MKKRTKYVIGIIIFYIVVVLLLIYFTSTFNTIYKWVYFSGDAALKSWISSDSEIIFEQKTDDFLLEFNDKSFYTAKKDGLLWVKDNFDSYSKNTTIRSTLVKDIVYIYGNVCLNEIEQVVLTSPSLRPIECKTDSIKSDDDQLLFYIEIPLIKLQGVPTLINFVDKSGNVISYADYEQDIHQMQLIKEVLSTLDSAEYSLSTKESVLSSFHKILSESYYITHKGKIEIIEEEVKFNFYDEYVTLQKCTRLFDGNDLRRYYSAFNLDYTEELIELKSFSS